MTLVWTLRVQIEDGCKFDFGFDKNESIGGFFRCVFNNCVNQSSIVRLPTFLSYDIQPVWNEALEWQFDDKTLKKLKKYGSSIKVQFFMIQRWNESMNAFPIHNFMQNKRKYNVHEIGYIVLDLKTAISNGTQKPSNIIQSTYHRIRNTKIIKNKGIYPTVKVSFWCALQKIWNDENNKPNDTVPCVMQTYTKKNEKKEETIPNDHNDDDDDEYITFNTLHPKMDYTTHCSDIKTDCASYKYRIGIDIRSIRDFDVSSVSSLQCKYKYNLFDNNHLFETDPSVLLHKSEEKTIDNGFCAYEVVLTCTALKANLYEYPLIIHCVGHHVNGYSFIDLYHLLDLTPSASNLRYKDEYHTIYSIKGDMATLETYSDLDAIRCKAIGNIRVCCSLEQFEIVAKESTSDVTNGCDTKPRGLEDEIMSELQTWKVKQQEECKRRWKELENKKLNDLEFEWKACEELRSEQLNKKKLEIIKLEKKLKTSLYDIEAQEKKLKMEQIRIEERKRELQQNYKLKTNEIVCSLKRLRKDHKMEIETLNRTITFLKNENELISAKYKNEEKRCNELRKELNKNKKQFESSSKGELQLENNKLNQEIIQLNHKCNERDNQIKRLNTNINELELKNKELQTEIVDTQQKQIDKEKKQMEKLKLELMTKSHFKQLRNDRNELLQIKNTLNKIMNHT